MVMQRVSFIAACFLLTATGAFGATPIAIFGTGHLAGKPDLAPTGVVDGNFILISCPTTAACVSNGSGGYNAYVTRTGQYPFPNWLPNTTSAQWISPAVGGNEMTIDPP